MKSNLKKTKILDIALDLLIKQGDQGLSMRQVAAEAQMSLSNVQYYYKNKDELLKALADRYFSACLEEIRDMPVVSASENARGEISILLKAFLRHGLEVSQMCRVFREFWAISTRNQTIDEHIRSYYREMVLALSNLLRPVAASESSLSIAVSMIIPFVEGYSITALAMPEDIDSVSKELTSIVIKLLQS